MAGRRPLVYSLFIDDINSVAYCWSWMEKDSLFSNYFARFLYNARIWTVMASSTWNLGHSRLLLDGDLEWVLFVKMISTS
jgi:hypothetical protein